MPIYTQLTTDLVALGSRNAGRKQKIIAVLASGDADFGPGIDSFIESNPLHNWGGIHLFPVSLKEVPKWDILFFSWIITTEQYCLLNISAN